MSQRHLSEACLLLLVGPQRTPQGPVRWQCYADVAASVSRNGLARAGDDAAALVECLPPAASACGLDYALGDAAISRNIVDQILPTGII